MKTPGQKAYEAAQKAEILGGPYWSNRPWSDLPEKAQLAWEQTAAAVTAPEPPPYGNILYAAIVNYGAANGFVVAACEAEALNRTCKSAASTLLAEYRKREGL